MTLAVLGLNHKSSRLELREAVQRNIEDIENAYSALFRVPGCEELIILSTCNRIEIYFSTTDFDKTTEEIKKFLIAGHADFAQDFNNSFYLFQDDDATRHCFTVAPGLDSMILGEPEILGQMKQAFKAAQNRGTLKANLRHLFEKTFQTAKEVRSKTDIGKGAVGTSSVTMGLAEKVCGSLTEKCILILGAGKLCEKLIKHFTQHGCQNIIVSTRRIERGKELADRYSVKAIPFEEWLVYLEKTDLFISATTFPSVLLTDQKLDEIMQKRKKRPLCLIDLAVPRTIAPEVAKIENVHAFNIEDLKGIGYQTLKFRESAMAQAYAIIHARSKTFLNDLRIPNFSSTVMKLNQLVHDSIHHDVWPALEPYLLSDEERKTAENAVCQLERNLAHQLIIQLKNIMLTEEIEDSDFLFAKLFQNDSVEVNLPDALKKYPDQFLHHLKKRFQQNASSFIAS